MPDEKRFDQLLTRREMEICGMLAQGLSSERIAKLLFLSGGTVRNYITSIYEKVGVRNRAQLVAKYVVEYAQAETEIPAQPSAGGAESGPKLRLVGLPDLPESIQLPIEGRPFIIGRFDVSIGHRQCDFEFDKATKAVSRRHSSVERTARGYIIRDLDSRAGTFLNGDRIEKPYLLKSGDRVSFGGAGADYVFEE